MADINYTGRKFVIFDVSELGTIDFSQVLETSVDSVRKSIDEQKTFVKYDGDMPSSISSLTTKGEELSHGEIRVLMGTEDWAAEELPEEEPTFD